MSEPLPAKLAALDSVREQLTRHGLKVNDASDLSAGTTRALLTGLQKLAALLPGQKLDAQQKYLVGSEVDLVAKRVLALRAGVRHLLLVARKN